MEFLFIAEIEHYLNKYTVTDQAGVVSDQQTFESGPGGNSVRKISRVSDYDDVLSILGLNEKGIHADYQTIEFLTLNTGDFEDRIVVRDSLGQSSSQLKINLGAGNDSIIVSDENQSLDGIVGHVYIDAQQGKNNSLIISDSGDHDADGNVVIEHSSIKGLASGDIHYAATQGGFESSYNQNTQSFESRINFYGGSGGNKIASFMLFPFVITTPALPG